MARKSRKGLETPVQPSVPKKTVYNVGVYVRLSVEDRKHRGDSLETQQAIIRDFIDDRDDLVIRETYIDNGLSGQSFERPAFLRMKDDMESGFINCCVTKDLSRLGRNAIDTGFYIENYFPRHGVRYIAVTDGYDSADGQSGGIMVSLKNMVNETIALEAGRKLRAHHQMLTREGGFSGAHPPYGYLKAEDNVHQLVPDEYAGAIVQRIFDMYLSGEGVTAILEWLNTDGILTPKQYFQTKGVGTGKMAQGNLLWGINIIKSILANRVYCGDIVRNKNKSFSRVLEKVPKEDWVISENKHEALISREMFDRVQEMRKAADNSHVERYDTPASVNIFRSKIVCGHCGRSMERVRPSEYIYKFRCPTRYSYAKSACVPVLIKESEVREKLLDMLRFINFDVKGDYNAESMESGKGELTDVQAERRKNQRLLDGLYESLIAGDITDAEYKDIKSVYSAKITEFADREKLLKQDERKRQKTADMLTKAATGLHAARNGSGLTAEIIDGVVEKIRVFDDRSLMVKFTFMERELPSREVSVYE